MKNFFLILFLLAPGFSAFAQDVIVLKKDETAIKCWIVSVNDSTITYKLLNKDDDIQKTVRRVDVVSFLFDHQSRNAEKNLNPVVNNQVVKIPLKKKPKPIEISDSSNPEISKGGILAPYHSGEIVAGFVVTNQGDTIQGTIKIKNVAENQMFVNFTDESGVKSKYTTNDLIAYGYKQVHYSRVNTGYNKNISNGLKSTDGTLFLHREVEGDASLYHFFTLFFPKGVFSGDPNPPSYLAKIGHHYLLTNREGKRILTKGRTIKGSINRLYSDNPGLMERVRMKGVKVHELPGIIRSQNDWYKNTN